jgi:hypothetical protein
MMENVGPLNLITRDNVAASAPALRESRPLSGFAASAISFAQASAISVTTYASKRMLIHY